MSISLNGPSIARVAIGALLSTFFWAFTPASPVAASAEISAQNHSVIAVGDKHSLAIDENGKLFAWGDNSYGQLGNGTSLDTNVPVAVSTAGFPADTSFVSVAANSDTSFALSSVGKLYGWGNNANGQLGDGTTVNRQTPVEVAVSGVVFTRIAVAYNHALAIADDGTVYSWGKNTSGQLGDGSYINQLVPVLIDTSGIAGSKIFISVAAGNSFSLGVTEDGILYSWGENSFTNKLGDGSGVNQSSPVLVSTSNIASGAKFVSVAAGSEHALALATDGSLYGWGSNWQGMIGDGTRTSRPIPVLVPTGVPMSGDSVVAISAGSYHSIALTAGGDVFTWGSGGSGSLGNGGRSGANTPTAVITSNLPEGAVFYSIAAGSNNSLAITSNGELYSWGYNGDGQLGIGLPPLVQPTPLAVSTSSLPVGTTFSAIAVGYDHSLALSFDGLLYAWGANDEGQLGDGTQSLSAVVLPVSTSSFPVGTTFSQIVAGKQYSMALSSEGVVYAWGDNYWGQLGDGTSVDSYLPVRVSTSGMPDPTTTFSSIAVGWYHSLALTANGQLFTWGSNSYAQLVRSTPPSDRKLPTPADSAKLPSGVTFTSLAANPLSTLALGSDGRIYGWGYNSYGQLGNGTNTSPNPHTTVSTAGALAGKSVVRISGGTHHFIGLDSAGALYSWGANTDEYSTFVGQLGVGGSPASSNLPLVPDLSLVPAATTFTFASAGYFSSTAISATGDLYAWGENSAGQLGNGTQVDAYLPTAVSTSSLPVGTTFKSFYAGFEHAVALSVAGDLYAQGKRDVGQLGDGATTLYQLIPAGLEFQGLAFSAAPDSNSIIPESSPTPSYTGPTLTANNQLVVAGSSVIFSGSKLDRVTAVYVGESLVEITSKTAGSITVRLPATLAAGSYDLMMHSSYGRLTVLGAVFVSIGSITDSSNSSTVDLEDLGSNLNLSDAAKLLIGKTKTIPNFAKDQTNLSAAQSTWLKDTLEDSGLTRIVCTGVIMESMSMHQKIQVRKLAKATCEEAAKYLGESSVWYQSKLTTKAAYVRKVMVTFKG